MLNNQHKWIYIYLFFTMCIGSFVLVEPSPSDLFMILLIIGCLFYGFYTVNEETVFPLIVLSLFLISNLISLFFVREPFTAVRYSGITFYLAFSWVCFVSLGHHFKFSLLQIVSKGYLISAVFAVLIGIAAYFNHLPMSDDFLMFGRVKSTFKDPNVFGPFLVMPALLAISLVEHDGLKVRDKILSFSIFLLLLTGIILSFSRAAWGNFALSFFLYVIIVKREFLMKRIKTIFILLLIGLPCLIYFIQTPIVEDLFSSRLMIKSYDSDRFTTQKEAIETGFINPLGIGPGHSELVFQYAPHSLYARLFTENGLIGILSFTIFFIYSTWKSFTNYWRSRGGYSVLFIVIFASLCGLAFNSFFIDTLHWRHLWIILALAYFPVFNDEKQTGEILSSGSRRLL
ncbi:hypothetical protein JSQ81_07100 [Sporosarcina sp. Marseille-Q4063]|uniref:O-antigen ligase family protein n=1 Tax=Sporosarcina sp. Marseille-Q4063 TaxID=2810514 RepID=UPI001BAE9CB4|nr:O-antigen ligase family protein [Sporosarcina sp. Marseille-Q4063]QUW23295.1 hypothetical protein JSQ81_07100 [Sporosarcina sp. Marseille-Q4063]